MLKRLFLLGWFRPQPYLKFVVAIILLAPIASTSTRSVLAAPLENPDAVTTVAVESAPVASQSSAPDATEATPELPAQIDPLDSPFPIPWTWITETQAEVSAEGGSGMRYYRSQPIVSPDGEYAAYTRVQFQVAPEMHNSRVSSVMFVENLKTGELQVVTAKSPLADNPAIASEDGDMPGAISVLMPVGWSQQSDRLLARQFEGLFNTSDASDYAVIWQREQKNATTVAPTAAPTSHNISILLGWSQNRPDSVLFRAGELGDENWSLWAVNNNGLTVAATELDKPIVFGKRIDQIWSGPQIAYR